MGWKTSLAYANFLSFLLSFIYSSTPLKAAPLENNQDMVQVAAGSFIMGSQSGDPDEQPPRAMQLKSYWIDKYEVSQAQYEQCIKAGACPFPHHYPDNIGPTLPVVGVSWHDAFRYCAWQKKRLPTEAEWERAARGTDGRMYPWGSTLDCTKANFGSFLRDGFCATINPGHILPVGINPAGKSPAGAYDMAGNVWEWVNDIYAPYPQKNGKTSVNTPNRSRRLSLPSPQANLDRPRIRRVIRGGSCCSYFSLPTTTNRLAFPPEYVDRDIGFRCAR